MFTSRAEFRLHLRIDNADRRLTPHGRRVGLIFDSDWAEFQEKQAHLASLKQLLEATRLTSDMVGKISTAFISCHPERSEAEPNGVEGPAFASDISSSTVTPTDLSAALGQPLAQLLKRPEITIEHLVPVLSDLASASFSVPSVVNVPSQLRNELKSVETEIKYAGYLQQQEKAIERLKKAEQRNIPEWFDYCSVSGLSREMQEKLLKVRPRTLGHASRIPGVTPAAVSLVNVYIEIQARRREQAAVL
jgi:tRNA uridine 5-carboxymethylaminomethyl modification enzyme